MYIYTKLVLIERFCGVLSWHLHGSTSAELRLLMPGTVVQPLPQRFVVRQSILLCTKQTVSSKTL
jgi:hypothetical protein